jgi:hypothetical protein
LTRVLILFAQGLLLGLLIGQFFKALARGAFTGNRYRKVNGRVQVKHPGQEWVYLEDHQADEKRKRENL